MNAFDNNANFQTTVMVEGRIAYLAFNETYEQAVEEVNQFLTTIWNEKGLTGDATIRAW